MMSRSHKPKLFLSLLLSAAFSLVALLLIADSISAAQNAPEIIKVEPPGWWAGHTINPVRLLVRGKNLSGARITSLRPEIKPSAIKINQAGSYLFVNIAINAAAKPGEYPLTLETAAGKATMPFRITAPLDPATHFQGITSDDVIYLIMPDRFANGDATNDAPSDSPHEANDRKNSRAWHGGDFRGIINRLPYLKDLGVTALWLTPWSDNWNGVNKCDKLWCPNTYYHGYHAIDYYAVEDRFGDLETLRELIEKAHALGLKIIQDQVANHVGSQHPWAKDPPLDNWFHGTLARHVQNEFRGDLLLSPHAAEKSRRRTLDGWFSDDLPDMNQDEPEVARYEIQNALWWVATTGIDGIRQDTIQYMPRAFIRDLSRALRRQHPKIWMVGEVFDRDPAHTAFFMGGRAGWDGIDTTLDSVFDFPVWQTSLDVFTGKKPARSLRDVLKYDALYADAARVATMASNHDVRRFVSLEGATLEGAMMHLAFTLTIRGIPQIYYGDEIAMEGGDDPDNRRDFPGGWPSDARNAFEPAGRTPNEQRMHEWTRSWIRLRRDHAAVRHGELIDLAFGDDVYVYARRASAETVIIAINRASARKQVSIPATLLDLPDGSRVVPLLGAKEGSTVRAGTIALDLPESTAAAYKIGSGN
jgi:neopullulanase